MDLTKEEIALIEQTRKNSKSAIQLAVAEIEKTIDNTIDRLEESDRNEQVQKQTTLAKINELIEKCKLDKPYKYSVELKTSSTILVKSVDNYEIDSISKKIATEKNVDASKLYDEIIDHYRYNLGVDYWGELIIKFEVRSNSSRINMKFTDADKNIGIDVEGINDDVKFECYRATNSFRSYKKLSTLADKIINYFNRIDRSKKETSDKNSVLEGAKKYAENLQSLNNNEFTVEAVTKTKYNRYAKGSYTVNHMNIRYDNEGSNKKIDTSLTFTGKDGVFDKYDNDTMYTATSTYKVKNAEQALEITKAIQNILNKN